MGSNHENWQIETEVPVQKPALVSVILGNYNYGRFLAEAIESVLGQSYRNLELVIVDDGSTDHSRQVISRYLDPRIRAVFKENGGQASCLNAGFEKVTGEYVAFLDSDDAWTPDKLARTVPVMESGLFSVVQHNLRVIDTDSVVGKRIHPCVLPGKRDVLRAYLERHDTDYFSVTSGLLCRKADLDRVFPLDVSWRICADVAFTRPLPLFGEVCTVPELLGYYRVHGNNGWMNSAAQARGVENARREFQYLNHWLEKAGREERLNFAASKYHTRVLMERLPCYHPLRAAYSLRELVWNHILYPMNMRLRMCLNCGAEVSRDDP